MVDPTTPNVRFPPDSGRTERSRSPIPAKGDKFKKVLAKERRHQDADRQKSTIQEEEKGEKAEKGVTASKERDAHAPAPSIFDLSSKTAPDTKPEESLSVLFSKEGIESVSKEVPPPPPPTEPKREGEDLFPREAPDLAQINPMVQGVAAPHTERGVEVAKGPIATTDVQEIVDQIVEKLYIVAESGRTDTTVVLKQPPIFAGAQVVLSSYKSAKGEFNILFENLTQPAKELLDTAQVRESLRAALEERGYVIHIMTTTTFEETRLPFEGEASSHARGDEDRGEDKREDQRREEKRKG